MTGRTKRIEVVIGDARDSNRDRQEAERAPAGRQSATRCESFSELRCTMNSVRPRSELRFCPISRASSSGRTEMDEETNVFVDGKRIVEEWKESVETRRHYWFVAPLGIRTVWITRCVAEPQTALLQHDGARATWIGAISPSRRRCCARPRSLLQGTAERIAGNGLRGDVDPLGVPTCHFQSRTRGWDRRPSAPTSVRHPGTVSSL